MEVLKDISLPNRESAPFIYDIGKRVVTGGATGFLVGYVFFKRRGFRRLCTYYGSGFGLGMSYT